MDGIEVMIGRWEGGVVRVELEVVVMWEKIVVGGDGVLWVLKVWGGDRWGELGWERRGR